MKRLFCDEMLQRLGRWLRAAGYDVELAEQGATDREIMRAAVEQQRLLLTRDREFLERREASSVFFLAADSLDAQAALLRDELGIDWLYRPFSRCLICNTELREAEARPPLVRAKPPLLHCPGCDRLYWEGAHVRRMRARLTEWRG